MPTFRNLFLLVFIAISLTTPSFCQTPSQTLRGTVTDADNARPLTGATIVLLETVPSLGVTTDENGNYRLPGLPVGRYRMQASFVGYETVIVAEVLVEAGKEAVQNVQLRERGEALQEVVVKAAGQGSAALHPVSTYTITVEEQFRFPATFYDPARLAMSFPGVTGENDGTNIISVRGNSPSALKWRLEGVEIVNPNHTSNAGTFSDRPTQSGGGVNILSAQLLGASSFLTGAFPAEYGDAIGGILDMRLRNGNDMRHEFTAQAGFLGLEAAAEGPIGSLQSGSLQSSVRQSGRASYLANFRYSFTGLLTAMGADFGDEATSFQDLSFNLALPAKKLGHFTLFGVGGKSETIFRSPEDSTLITEDKERFDIDFHSKMGALGMTHLLPVGKKSVWRTTMAVSALRHNRTAVVANPSSFDFGEADHIGERKTSLSSVFSTKINSRHRLKGGIYVNREIWRNEGFFPVKPSGISFTDQYVAWLVQPFAEWNTSLSSQTSLTVGLHASHLTNSKASTSLEPRVVLAFTPTVQAIFTLAYGLHSQQQLPQIYYALFRDGKEPGFTKSHHFVAGISRSFDNSLVLRFEAYCQWLFNVPVSTRPASIFSVLNLTDFSTSYITNSHTMAPDTLIANGTGNNYGIDISLQKFISDRYYFLLAGSLYRSLFTVDKTIQRPTRFDGKYLLNLTGGREFVKQKEKKTVIKGINARVVWHGGYRDRPIDLAASAENGYTVFQDEKDFSSPQPDYFRIDLRFYIKWNKTGRKSTLSLDIQNATSRKNVAYDYYDNVQQNVVTKKQLGMIPILSYRVEF